VIDDLSRTLTDIAILLEGQGIRFAVIGGIAVGVHGEPRFTADVDAIIGTDVDRALALIQLLDQTPFRALFSDVAEVVQSAFILPLRHRETQIRVDLAIGLTGFEKQLIDRADDITIAARNIPVATPEDLILLKLLAARPRDMDDVSSIVARQGESIDWQYLRQTGKALQDAVSQDIVSVLERLRGT
jgi:predicted nucleotidyltransferase